MDRDIRAAVYEELVTDPLIDADDIVVGVFNGDVPLDGTVPSQAERSEAAAVAQRVAGVTVVHNGSLSKGACEAQIRVTSWVEVVGQGCACRAGGGPGRAEHDVVDQQLRAPSEQVGLLVCLYRRHEPGPDAGPAPSTARTRSVPRPRSGQSLAEPRYPLREH